jgi:hypothetical protein
VRLPTSDHVLLDLCCPGGIPRDLLGFFRWLLVAWRRALDAQRAAWRVGVVLRRVKHPHNSFSYMLWRDGTLLGELHRVLYWTRRRQWGIHWFRA